VLGEELGNLDQGTILVSREAFACYPLKPLVSADVAGVLIAVTLSLRHGGFGVFVTATAPK